MKKIVSLFLLVAIAATNVNAHGTTPASPTDMAVVKAGSTFKLFYRGEQAGKVQVTIYDNKGKVVFRETLRNTENFMRPYNFSALPEGIYTIQLSDEQGTRVQKVAHSLSSREEVAHLTHLKRGERKYLLTVPNRGPNVLSVKIFNERNALLYQNTEVIAGDFAKVYNLSQIEGASVFEIVDQNGKRMRLTKP